MVRGPLDRVDELRRGYTLEQVADGTGVQHLHDRLFVAVRRHREDPRLRCGVPKLPRDARSSAVRQPRVNDRHVRQVELTELDRRQGVLRDTHELERRRAIDCRAERLAEFGVVVDEENRGDG